MNETRERGVQPPNIYLCSRALNKDATSAELCDTSSNPLT